VSLLTGKSHKAKEEKSTLNFFDNNIPEHINLRRFS
jgi:hypothetical protein